jgi:DNA-binding CsgD family transcriptional regulator
MPRPPKFRIVLTAEESAVLESLRGSAPNARIKKRAAVILLLAVGATQEDIARQLQTSQSRVSIIAMNFSNEGRLKWITHFSPIGPPRIMSPEQEVAFVQKYREGKAKNGHSHSLRDSESERFMSYGTRRNTLRRAG